VSLRGCAARARATVTYLAAGEDEETLNAELLMLLQRAFECRAENPPRKPRELVNLADADPRVVFVDVTPLARHDQDPQPAVIRGLMALDEEHDVLLVRHRYDPIPLRDLFAARSFASWAEERRPHDWYIYFYRPSAGAAAAARRSPSRASSARSRPVHEVVEKVQTRVNWTNVRARGLARGGADRIGEAMVMIGVEQLKRVLHSEVRGVTDPLEMLVECHRKIERHLDALVRAGEVLRRGSDAERQSAFFAIDMARAHFAGPLVKHTQDEELSLFPRLRRSDSAAAREALAAVAGLERQHREAEALHAEFERLAGSMPRAGQADAGEVSRLNAAIAALREHYREHIAVENCIVFPAAACALTAEDLRQFGQEMRARRALTLRR